MPHPKLQTVFGANGNPKSDRLTRFHRIFYGLATDEIAKKALAIADEANIESFVKDNRTYVQDAITRQILDNVGPGVKKGAANFMMYHQLKNDGGKISIPDAIRAATNMQLLETIGIHHEVDHAEEFVGFAHTKMDEIEKGVASKFPHNPEEHVHDIILKAKDIIINQLLDSAGEDESHKGRKMHSSFGEVLTDATTLARISILFKDSAFSSEASALLDVADIPTFMKTHGDDISRAVESKIDDMVSIQGLAPKTKEGIAKYIVAKLNNGTYESIETAVENATEFMKTTTNLDALEEAVHHANSKMAELVEQVKVQAEQLAALGNGKSEPDMGVHLANTSAKLNATVKQLMTLTNDTAAEASLLIHLLAVVTTTLDGVSKIGKDRDDAMTEKINALIHTLAEAEGEAN